jgi:hypothetical protein
MISFAMTEEQEGAREAMRTFAADAMRPPAREYDEALGNFDAFFAKAGSSAPPPRSCPRRTAAGRRARR